LSTKIVSKNKEPVSKRFSFFKFKEGENFNRRNTCSISRIALKLHCVPKFEPDAEIGQISADFELGRFEIGSRVRYYSQMHLPLGIK